MKVFDGSWTNSYGSILQLASEGRFLFGCYRSSTGATGQYHVCGYGDVHAPSKEQGVGVALSILWRSYQGGTPDPTWNWVSGFGGQMILQSDGTPNIILNHDMVATVPDPHLAGIGSYIDKLVYVPVDNADADLLAPVRKHRLPAHADPVDGNWRCKTPELDLSLELTLRDEISGWLDGYMHLDGRHYLLQGFADNGHTESSVPLEGLTLSAATEEGKFMAFSGWLDRVTGELVLLQQTSSGTAASAQYTQTSARTLYFRRSH